MLQFPPISFPFLTFFLTTFFYFSLCSHHHYRILRNIYPWVNFNTNSHFCSNEVHVEFKQSWLVLELLLFFKISAWIYIMQNTMVGVGGKMAAREKKNKNIGGKNEEGKEKLRYIT